MATVAAVMQELDGLSDRDVERLRRENAELRAAVKAQPRLVELKTYDAADYFMSGLICSARLLEERGDRCHIAFSRDADGTITGVTLSVEDL